MRSLLRPLTWLVFAALAFSCHSAAYAQTTRDSTFCQKCIPVTVLKADSAQKLVPVSVWQYHLDSTQVSVLVPVTQYSSSSTTTYRDSVIKVAVVVPPVQPPVDTAKPPVTPPSTGYAPPSIYSCSFEAGAACSGMDPFSSAASVFPVAAVTGQKYSAGMNWPSGSGASSRGWLIYPGKQFTEVWVRFGMWFQGTYQGSGATGMKIMRLYGHPNGNDAYLASFGLDSGNQWLWDFGASDDPNRSSNRHPTLPRPGLAGWAFGTWHWIEWHYKGVTGQKATIEIYFDGAAMPAYSASSDFAAPATVGNYFEIYSTINGPFTGPFSYRFDDVAYSTTRIGLPAGAKIGTP
jgi:hypothetical protein